MPQTKFFTQVIHPVFRIRLVLISIRILRSVSRNNRSGSVSCSGSNLKSRKYQKNMKNIFMSVKHKFNIFEKKNVWFWQIFCYPDPFHGRIEKDLNGFGSETLNSTLTTFVVRSAPQAKFFESKMPFFLEWQVCSKFNISIFSGQKRTAGNIFLNTRYLFVKMQVVKSAPEAKFWNAKCLLTKRAIFFKIQD